MYMLKIGTKADICNECTTSTLHRLPPKAKVLLDETIHNSSEM